MKANQVSKTHAIFALVLLIASIAVAGCSSQSNNAPKSLAEQQKDILNPPPIPPDILAKYRNMYGKGGSEDQKIQQSVGAAGAAKQAADANSQPR